MAQNFPSNPVLGDQYQDYVFDGTSWKFAQTLPGGLPCGSVITWAGATAPANWLLCDGSAVSRTTYSSLFAVIGTTYGAGDGSTTFNLPDLRGRVPVGKNGGTFGTLGSTGGAETHTLDVSQMPSHNHGGSTSTTGAHSHSLNGKVNISQNGYGQNSPINGNAGNFADGSALSAGDHSHTISSQGGGAAHNNLQPYQVLNYIIKHTVAVTPGESELAPRVSAVETGKANLAGATFGGDVFSDGKVVGTTPINAGSTGGVSIKAPSSGSQTSGFLQFVNNAYNAQWASLEATSSSELKLNASYVKTPYQPTFFAWQPESGTYQMNGGKPVFTSTLVNVGSNYNTSNGRFTAPTAGIYEFSAQMLLRSSSTNGEATFYKNDANVIGRNMSYSMPVGSNAHDPVHFTVFLSLAAGDFVDVRVSVISGGDWYFGGGLGWFAGRLVG